MGTHNRLEARRRRRKRVRTKVAGTPERPRLNVHRTSKHIYAQIIDDVSGATLVETSSLGKELRDQVQGKGGNKVGALLVGESIAKRALEKGLKKVVFDRNGFLYHGRIKAVAESARANGLEF